jgi:uncharacterized sulfatase
MTRRSFLLAALAPSKPLNVLFIVADDMNTALGCYGHPVVKTPHLDAFARRAVTFHRAYCQFPLCAPSRTSFLSGLRPATTRVLSLKVPTRRHLPDAVMLPQFFRNAGYYTAQCGKIFHTGTEFEDPRSWDFMEPDDGKKAPLAEILEKYEMPGPRNHSMEWDILRTPDAETPDGKMARLAVEQMRIAQARNKPFFIGLGFRRPHSPYAVPKPYFDLYDPASLRLPDPGNPHSFPPAAQYELPQQPRLSAKEQREYTAAYYASNSFVDAQAGHVFRALDERNLWDSTIVVFFGDHGYHNGEHGMWHKMTLFDESTRVPLLIAVPGAKGAGKVCNGQVELVDLYPTLAAAAGRPIPAGLEGISLLPWIDDPAKPGKPAVYTMVGRNDDGKLSHHQPSYFGRSVRTDRWRYTEWDGGKRGLELYDQRNDPREMTNLASDPAHAPVIAQMRSLLRR